MPASNAVGSSTCYVSSCEHGDWITIGYTMACRRLGCYRTVSRPYDTMLDAGWMLAKLAQIRVMDQSTNAAGSTSNTSAIASS